MGGYIQSEVGSPYHVNYPMMHVMLPPPLNRQMLVKQTLEETYKIFSNRAI